MAEPSRLKGLQEQARKLDDMIEKGDAADLEKALAQLGDDLRGMRKMLDQNADGFGSERFPQENRVVAELMKKIGDIEGDERALQKETQAISEKQEAEVERRLKGQMDELLKREGEKIDRLKQKLGSVPSGDPESAAQRGDRSGARERQADAEAAGRARPGGGQRARRNAPRPAWSAPASTWTSWRRRAAPVTAASRRSMTSGPMRSARRARWPRRSPTICRR